MGRSMRIGVTADVTKQLVEKVLEFAAMIDAGYPRGEDEVCLVTNHLSAAEPHSVSRIHFIPGLIPTPS